MSGYFGADPDLVALLDDFFIDRCTPELRSRADGGDPPTALWVSMSELGLAHIGVAEDVGGAGGGLDDAMAVAAAVGRHAVPFPVTETQLASRVLTEAGRPLPSGPAVVFHPEPGAVREQNGRLDGRLDRVPWGRCATVAVVLGADGDATRSRLAIVERDTPARVEPGRDLAGQPRDTLWCEDTPCTVLAARAGVDELRRADGLLRSARMAGALAAISALTRTYTGERVQFGKPIAAFQAVQQHLVVLAQAATSAQVATESAAVAARNHGYRAAAFELDAARTVVTEDGAAAARAAHQAHGAIGLTREYGLHHHTRRLHQWCADERSIRAGVPSTPGRAIRAHGSVSRVVTSGYQEGSP